MKIQKIVNLLNGTYNKSSKFARRKWYVINDQNNREYGEGNENDSSINFETKVIKSSLSDYSNVYILVTGDIATTVGDVDTNFAFKNCAPFARCVAHINDEHIDTAKNLDIIMRMYNLIEYSDNYSDTSGSLQQTERDEQNMSNGNPANVTTKDSSSFKYKSGILGNSAADGILKNLKIDVPLKYLTNSWRSLEMLLISCKIHLELNWTKKYVMSNIIGDTIFKIPNTKLYVVIVALLTKDKVKLTKQLNNYIKYLKGLLIGMSIK